MDVSGIEKLLFSTHMMLAASTKTPELVLDESEAKSLAAAIRNVERHYDMGVSEKAADWANLMMVIGAVYGTRIVAIGIRTKKRSNKNSEQ